jgi:hypothetical protein
MTVHANEPLFLNLRIYNGKNTAMLQIIANTLTKYVNNKRLDFRYYGCKRQKELCMLPLKDIAGKVLVFANSRFDGSPIAEFINAVWSHDGMTFEYTHDDLVALVDDKRAAKAKEISQGPSWSHSANGSNRSGGTSTYDITVQNKGAVDMGVTFPAQYFGEPSDGTLDGYRKWFGAYSWKLKATAPYDLRMPITLVQPPKGPDGSTNSKNGVILFPDA